MLSFLKKRSVLVSATTMALIALVFGVSRLARSATTIPTAAVQKKDFIEYLDLRGNVKASKSTVITAPAAAGDLQILWVVPNGTKVKAGEKLVEFDATDTKQSLAQDLSALKSAEAEIEQVKAAAKLKEEADVTEVMKARFAVENARMETKKQEIVSEIEGKEARLKLEDAEHALAQQEATLKADRSASAANLDSKQKKKDAAAFQVERDRKRLAALTLLSPTEGIVVVENNWQAAGPMQQPGPFKAGDRTSPGSAIATIPDASKLQITARVEESQRGRVKLGQAARFKLEAVPGQNYDGRVEEISPTASVDFQAGWPFPKNFTLTLSLAQQDSRLTPGMGANVRVAVDQVAAGLVVPSNAVFRKGGQSVVYVRNGSRFDETVVEIGRRSGDEVLIARGVRDGESVALKDPSVTK